MWDAVLLVTMIWRWEGGSSWGWGVWNEGVTGTKKLVSSESEGLNRSLLQFWII